MKHHHGKYTLKVKGEEYKVEICNYTENSSYVVSKSMGNKTAEKRMLILKYNKNLEIAENVQITSEGRNKKGMFICVAGELTNNGTITMSGKGTINEEGQNVYLWKNTNGSYEYVPAVGAVGGARSTSIGNNGEERTGRQTGGGGSGSTWSGTAGAGATGTSYSGGSGGGGVYGTTGNDAQPNGGSGGAGKTTRSDYNVGSGSSAPGGLLTIYAKNIINLGTVTADGGTGGSGNYRAAWTSNSGTYYPARYAGGAGGGSGGGSVNIFYENIENYKTITAKGGSGGTSKNQNNATRNGGAGGNGSVCLGSVSSGDYEVNL